MAFIHTRLKTFVLQHWIETISKHDSSKLYACLKKWATKRYIVAIFNTCAAVCNEERFHAIFTRWSGNRRFSCFRQKMLGSPKLLEALAFVCSSLKTANKLPELDNKTGWNSIWLTGFNVTKVRKLLEKLMRSIQDWHKNYTEFTVSPRDPLCREITSQTGSATEDFPALLNRFMMLPALCLLLFPLHYGLCCLYSIN